MPLPALHAERPDPRCPGNCASQPLGFDFGYAFQPIVDVAARSVWGHEALVRGPAGEPAPTVLAQVSDANRYKFDQACRVKAIRTAAEIGLQERLSINFLPNAIYRPEVCIQTTLQAARTHGWPIERIVFEATEGERVADAGWLAEVLAEYQRMGFLTALDDFGAGYAGLNLLANFQPDIVKIDMELVRNVHASRARQAITHGVLRICQELGITVIAEGVETADERDFFLHAGVRLMQGYAFARPAFRQRAAIDPAVWG
jgi:EAL domain-containing protein (putative c-di-GMP-specific phosphodiesterase class I)